MVQLKLDPIQLGGVLFLEENYRAIINLFTGLGKTDLFLQYVCGKTLKRNDCMVIVPKSLQLNWFKLVKDYGLDAYVTVIKYGQIKSHMLELAQAKIICVDEPKLLKNANNQVFKQLNLIKESADRMQQRILLDATIIENNLGELDVIAEWLGVVDRFSVLDLIYPKNSLQNKAVRPVNWKQIKIPIPAHREAVVKFYELELARALIPRIKSKNAVNLAISTMLDSLNAINSESLGSAKLGVLMDLIRVRHSADAGIICVTRKDAMNKIFERLHKNGLSAARYHGSMSAAERKDVVEKFELGVINWVIATKAGERGLNLSRGNVVFHYDLPWSGSALVQRDRVTRRDSDLSKETYVYVLLFADTVEELVYKKVKAKVKLNKDLGEGMISTSWSSSWKEFLVDKWLRWHNIDLTEQLR